MTVSVVIPAYNAAATIAQTLESLLAQSHSSWEAIVVDDGSRDDTAAIVTEFADRDARIQLVRQPNGGEAAARNTGVQHARAEWLLFLDADDWIDAAHLEKMTAALSADPSLDAVHCGYARVAADGALSVEPYRPPVGDLFPILARRAVFPVHACVVRRGLVKAVGPFDSSLRTSTDWDFWQRVARTGARFGSVPDVLAFYRMSPQGASLNGPQLFSDGLRVLRQGQAADARVAKPHPSHRDGATDPIASQQFYLLAWCAGLMLGADQDPLTLFSLVAGDRFPELYPLAIAQCVFDAAPLPSCQTSRGWESLWPRLESRVASFFATLESRSGASGLASAALRSLKRMIATTAPFWPLLQQELDDLQALIDRERSERQQTDEAQRQQLSEAETRQHERERALLDAQQLGREQRERVAGLERSLGTTREESAALSRAFAEAQQSILALHDEQAILARSLVEQQQAMSALLDAQLGMQGDLIGLQDAHVLLHTEHDALQDEQHILRDAHTTLEREHATLGNEHAVLQSAHSTLQDEHAGLAHAFGEEQQSLATLRSEHTALQQSFADLQQSEEQRLGDLLLNRWRLRTPVRHAVNVQNAVTERVEMARLGIEGRLPNGSRPKVLATACDIFPIYSQTFVYQELVQLANSGFDLRFVYSKLDTRDRLGRQFDRLWDMKRRLHLNRPQHERDYAHYAKQAPGKMETLLARLSDASGLSVDHLAQHDNVLQACSFTRMVEAYRPDYLHSYFFYDRSLMSLVAGYLLDLPRGISCYADHLLKDYELKVVPLHLELCDIVIATSARIKEELRGLAPNVDASRILVKPNGIDTGRFPLLERSEPGASAAFRLVTVCRIEPKKGLLELVGAVSLLRSRGLDVEAHIVGTVDEWSQASRDYKDKLDQRITELDLWGKVHLEGRQNLDGILRFLGLAQIFVAPFVETETGDKDGIPTALLEGMATGLPVVATNAGSIQEVIETGREGLVVPQRHEAALADAIEELLRAPERRREFGQHGRQTVLERFDAGVVEQRFHERLRMVLANRRR